MNSLKAVLEQYKQSTDWLDLLETETELQHQLDHAKNWLDHQDMVQGILANRPAKDRGFYKEMLGVFLENVEALSLMGHLTGKVLESSKQTYYQNAPLLQYSLSCKEKLLTGFNNFAQVPVPGADDEKRNIYQQLNYCRDLGMSFAKTYDPENDLDMQNAKVDYGLEFVSSLVEKQKYNTRTCASYKGNNRIEFKYHVNVADELVKSHPDHYPEYLLSLVTATKRSLSNGDDLKPAEKGGTFIIPQDDPKIAGLLVIPAFSSRGTAAYSMGHELIHQALDAVNKLYNRDAQKAFADFGYTKKDHLIHKASHSLYVNAKDNYEQYLANVEEKFARNVEGRIIRQMQSSGIATPYQGWP